MDVKFSKMDIDELYLQDWHLSLTRIPKSSTTQVSPTRHLRWNHPPAPPVGSGKKHTSPNPRRNGANLNST